MRITGRTFCFGNYWVVAPINSYVAFDGTVTGIVDAMDYKFVDNTMSVRDNCVKCSNKKRVASLFFIIEFRLSIA